jgi:hypothetical protein
VTASAPRAARLMRFAPVSVVAALVWALFEGPAAADRGFTVDRTFAGSVQLDEHVAPTLQSSDARARVFDGFTTEISLKLAADLTEHFSANVKVCYGCHGFEADMAYLDLRLQDELNLRIGRFSPSFGAFNLRHDPANHKLPDKPLPYDMGRMLRMRDWNLGVLPSPFPDNGAEINGTHWFGDAAQLDYAVYAVSGLKGDDNQIDLDFIQSRNGNLYYVDNNGTPAGGARIAITGKINPFTDLTVGASGMYGLFDPQNRLSYAIVGADLWLRVGRTNLRAEWLVRRQEFDTSDPTIFKYAVSANGNFFVKHGAYVELEQPLGPDLDAIVRVDGLVRLGNVAPTSPLSNEAFLVRYTVGASYALTRGVRFKLAPELWQFDYRDVTGRKLEASLHVAIVGAL